MQELEKCYGYVMIHTSSSRVAITQQAWKQSIKLKLVAIQAVYAKYIYPEQLIDFNESVIGERSKYHNLGEWFSYKEGLQWRIAEQLRLNSNHYISITMFHVIYSSCYADILNNSTAQLSL